MKNWWKKINKKKEEIRSCPEWLMAVAGVIFGGLICGVALALTVTFWLKSTTTTSTMSSTSATTIVTTTPFRVNWSSTGRTVAGVTLTTGIASHLLFYPIQLTVDSSNNIFVVDGSNHRIQKWTSGATNGTTVVGQANGVCGSALNFLCYPSDVTLDSNGNFYVLDGGNHRVVFWTVGSSSGTVVAGTSGVAGNGSNQFWDPLGLARDATSGTLFISDSQNHRVMRYLSGASSGTIVAGGNGAGLNSNQLNKPRGLFYDASTNSLLIANNQGHNILRWTIGASSWILVTGSSIGLIGTSSNLLNYPTDVVLDSQGNLYVSDEGNQRIQFYLSAQSNGTTVAGVTATSGSSAQLFSTPSSVAVDSQFNIYVTDYNNYRVQLFSHQ